MRNILTNPGSVFALVALAFGTGCAGATIQPGHRALYFDPRSGGIQHEVLQPGWYRTACAFWEPNSKCPRVDDFDVTFSTSKEASRRRTAPSRTKSSAPSASASTVVTSRSRASSFRR